MKKLCTTGLLFAFVTGCGSKGGSAPTAMECSAGLTDAQAIAQAVVRPEAFDSKYTRFLVETDGNKQALIQSLKPSGTTVHEYRVMKFDVNVESVDDRWQAVEFKGGDRSALLEQLMKTPGVTSIEPDYEIRADDFVEEAAATEQWAHRKVESADAWRVTRGSTSVIVAVLDGGVDIGHPDLAQNVYHNTAEVVNGRDDDGNGYVDDVTGWDYVSNDNDPRSDSAAHFHGSHVAGIIGGVANRSAKLIGHSQVVRILPLKFIDADGKGNTSHAIQAIDYAIAKGADIINASWSSTNYSAALYAAIKRAQNAGILFVAAGGNDGQNNDATPHYPANYGLSNILSIGASTSTDKLADYSDYGVRTVDFAAPGSGIYSLKNNGQYATMSGTSMATPLVSGIAVLVKAHHMSFGYYKIAQSLIMGVDKITSMKTKVKYGGRINARKALEAADQVYNGKGVTIESADPGPCG